MKEAKGIEASAIPVLIRKLLLPSILTTELFLLIEFAVRSMIHTTNLEKSIKNNNSPRIIFETINVKVNPMIRLLMELLGVNFVEPLLFIENIRNPIDISTKSMDERYIDQ